MFLPVVSYTSESMNQVKIHTDKQTYPKRLHLNGYGELLEKGNSNSASAAVAALVHLGSNCRHAFQLFILSAQC